MTRGKMTPLHTHPVDEALYVLDGAIRVQSEGREHDVAQGGVAVVSRGLAHAFTVTADRACTRSSATPDTRAAADWCPH